MGTLRKPAGFSLLELLVVVIIAGILAGIAVPSYNRYIEKTRMRDAEGKLNLIFQAERIYRLDNGAYGTLLQLIPNYCPSLNTDEFNFTIPSNSETAFTARATRLSGSYTTGWIEIKETGVLSYDGTKYQADGNPSS